MLNSLGIDKEVNKTRVVVAMSGGVDSSVVAAYLAGQGYEVIGITLQLYDHGEALAKKGACCAGRDIHDARHVAEIIGCAHYVLNYENRFKEAVIDEFSDAYLAGATPVPCIRCNERIKFQDLLETAHNLEADCMATGHYICRKMGAKNPELHMAADPQRDQSYFLFSTTKEQLNFLRFPLGALSSKDETRAMARKYGLNIAEKPDSQDICFVPNGNYAAVIEKLHPGAAEPGDIIDTNGRILGQHRGIIHFTIGQRRGLSIGGHHEPLYVVRLDPKTRHVIVGKRTEITRQKLTLMNTNWLGDDWLEDIHAYPLRVKIRSTHKPVDAQLTHIKEGQTHIILDKAEEGVSPGQACVFYEKEGTRVLGGGWISQAFN